MILLYLIYHNYTTSLCATPDLSNHIYIGQPGTTLTPSISIFLSVRMPHQDIKIIQKNVSPYTVNKVGLCETWYWLSSGADKQILFFGRKRRCKKNSKKPPARRITENDQAQLGQKPVQQLKHQGPHLRSY